MEAESQETGTNMLLTLLVHSFVFILLARFSRSTVAKSVIAAKHTRISRAGL
jgi:hypothetical protein